MKKLVSEYTFNPILKVITSPDFSLLENILLVTNVTSNDILYNFADPEKGGSIVENSLFLDVDTSLMNSSDRLQIFVDVPNPDFVSLNELLSYGLAEIVHQLQSIKNDGGMADTAGRVRVNVEYLNSGINNFPTTINSIYGLYVNLMAVNTMNISAKSLRNQITKS